MILLDHRYKLKAKMFESDTLGIVLVVAMHNNVLFH